MFSWLEKVWWYFVPWIEINVKWPVGYVSVDPEYPNPNWIDQGSESKIRHSADPNDHYRPFMEKWIGRQGPDWQWYLANNDAAENRLTIRMRRKFAVYASHIAIMWN